MRLLNQALNVTKVHKPKLNPSDEEIELFEAYLDGKINLSQAAIALTNNKIITSKYNYYGWVIKMLQYCLAAKILVKKNND